MRIDPSNVDKFAALFRAGKPRRARAGASREAGGRLRGGRSQEPRIAGGGQRSDDAQPLGGITAARPSRRPLRPIQANGLSARRQREIEALEYDQKRHKRYLAARAHRIARILQESPSARKFVATLERLDKEDKLGPVGWCTVQADIAEYAARLRLQTAIAGDYDRFTIWEIARETVVRVCTKAGFDEDHTPFFTKPEPTTLSELKEAMGLT